MLNFHNNDSSISAYSKQCSHCNKAITKQAIIHTEFCRFDMYTHSIIYCSDKCYNKHKAQE